MPIDAVGAAVEQRLGVATQADGAVHVRAAALRLQEPHDLTDHHRQVLGHVDIRWKAVEAPLDAELGQGPRVVVGIRLAVELGQEPFVVPDLEEVVFAEHVHLAGHLG